MSIGVGQALSAVAPFAGAIAISPVTIGLVLTLIVGCRGRAHVHVFLATWFAAITAATIVLLALLPPLSSHGTDAAFRGSPTLAPFLGAVLLGLAAAALWRSRRARSRPSLISHLDRASPVTVIGLAAVFALNPKNMALAAAGVDAISGPVPSGLGLFAVALCFAAIASIPITAAAGAAAVLPSTADGVLRRANTWLSVHGDAAAAAVLAVVGLWLVVSR